MRIKESLEYILSHQHPEISNRKMSKYYVAKTVGCQPIMIDKWMNGEVAMSNKYRRAFKKHFGVEVDKGQKVMSVVNGELVSSILYEK